MKTLSFLFFLVASTLNATAALPINPGVNTTLSIHATTPRAHLKNAFFKRVIEKTLQKHIHKSAHRPYGDNGKWRCIFGFVIGLLVILSSPISVGLLFTFGYAAFIAYLILSFLGLGLSIWGLQKARGWERTRKIRTLAIIGIVLNGIIAAAAAIFLLFLLMGSLL